MDIRINEPILINLAALQRKRLDFDETMRCMHGACTSAIYDVSRVNRQYCTDVRVRKLPKIPSSVEFIAA